MSPKKSKKSKKLLQTKKAKSSSELMSMQELKLLRQKEHDRLRKLEQERFSEEEILRLQSEALSSTKSSTESNVLIRVNMTPPENRTPFEDLLKIGRGEMIDPVLASQIHDLERQIAETRSMVDKAKKTS